MCEADLAAASEVSAAAFGNDISDSAARADWERRMAHAFRTDPAGSFVAERDGRLLGVAEAIRRDELWVLSMLAVVPSRQSGGVGRALLEAALGYWGKAQAGLIVSSNDPRALRLYGLAGFALRPTFSARGDVRRAAIPRGLPPVRETEDLAALAAVSRAVRGAPLAAEWPLARARGGRALALADRGFVVVMPGHGIWTLHARDGDSAAALLWHGLEAAGAGSRAEVVRWVTGEQQWAVEVLLRAGLELVPYGALAVRGRPGTLWPYIPSPPFA
jgi:GNAT superfamily N-acetyltransferase